MLHTSIHLNKSIIGSGHYLATVAGLTNVLTLLTMYHDSISHVTGNITRLSYNLSRSEYGGAVSILIILLSFMAGAMVSGYVTGGSRFQPRRRYGLLLLLEGICLTGASALLMSNSIRIGEYVASFACGLQNGIFSIVSGAIVRTTHMTGILTDIGTQIGILFRTGRIHRERIALHIAILAGFINGGFWGALLFPSIGYFTLTATGSSLILVGLVYFIIRSTNPALLERIFQYHDAA
jgi:uncharacterized membrane protein YoaK (UPF0700 family)